MNMVLSGQFAGLSGLELGEEPIDLGGGIILSKTYAHLMAPFMMAFKPAVMGKPHPAPWKAMSGGFEFDVTAQLFVPAEIKAGNGSVVARMIVSLLRLWVNPGVTLLVLSNKPFSLFAQTDGCEANLVPVEVFPRYFPLSVNKRQEIPKDIEWVKENWMNALELAERSSEFRLAIDVLDSGQFISNTALTMVSLWGALESLFLSSNAELKFRVSSFIAAYIEKPGNNRISLQKMIAKLYDKRSAAAHGKPEHESDDLLNTFILLRNVMIKIVEAKHVPTKEELENLLFGSVSADE
jgi:hypothetical protein